MATTTNYGWTTPDDTALVKDGAAAIRTLGSSVDTTTKNLNPSTTLGDIEYRSSSANTNTRLGIGSTGNVLTVAGGVPTWAAPAGSGGMTLLSTTTLSGASTTISSISGSYTHLQAVIYGKTSASASIMEVQPNSDTGSLYTRLTIEGLAGSSQQYSSANYTAIEIPYNYGINATNTDNVAILNIYNYASTAMFKVFNTNGYAIQSTSTKYIYTMYGTYQSASAITSLKITAVGTTFNAGTVLLYGVK
jgi:hypothetical protein